MPGHEIVADADFRVELLTEQLTDFPADLSSVYLPISLILLLPRFT